MGTPKQLFNWAKTQLKKPKVLAGTMVGTILMSPLLLVFVPFLGMLLLLASPFALTVGCLSTDLSVLHRTNQGLQVTDLLYQSGYLEVACSVGA